MSRQAVVFFQMACHVGDSGLLECCMGPMVVDVYFILLAWGMPRQVFDVSSRTRTCNCDELLLSVFVQGFRCHHSHPGGRLVWCPPRARTLSRECPPGPLQLRTQAPEKELAKGVM